MALALPPNETPPCYYCGGPTIAIVVINHCTHLVCGDCLMSPPTKEHTCPKPTT